VHSQVILVLRWLRHRLYLRLLARDAGVSIATAYRYLHEGLGGTGILLDDTVMRRMADLKALSAFEGTDRFRTRSVGRDIIGRRAVR
jgi:hypothetical protein